MEGFQEWFSNKVTISRFPIVEEVQDGQFDDCSYRINVSDIFRPEIDALFKHAGVDSLWFLMGEAFGMSLESLYGAMRIMWEAERQSQSLLLHCYAGRALMNRSLTATGPWIG